MIVQIILALIFGPWVIIGLLSLIRKNNYPEKSLYNCFLNVVLSIVRFFKLGPFKQGKITMDKAMKYAMKKTKLNDFGELTFVDNYSVLLDCPAHKKLQLTPLGYIMYRLELNMTMVRRLKIIDYIKRNTEILNIPVRSPVFVYGLPRTGTTFLHRLLSLDPAVRSPLLWELLAPIPSVSGESQEALNADNEKRAKFIRKLIKTRKSMGDNALSHIHEIGADLPEECIMSLTDEIPVHLSCLYTLYFNSDKFFTDIDFERVVKAYTYYKKVLQLLSWNNGEREQPRRWMLKCPIHLFYTKEIAAVFPDAKIIWTHRHPVSSIPSMCSLVKSLHQVYYDNESRDDAAIGKNVAAVSVRGLLQVKKDLDSVKLPCANILYDRLIENPIQIVKEIYQQFNWEFTTEYETILKNFLEEDRLKREKTKSKKGHKDVLHPYTPEEFSLTSEQLSTGLFADYVNEYNVPMSRN